MKTKPLKFLLALIFLFLFSGFVYDGEPEAKKEYWENGKLRLERHYQDGKLEGLSTYFYENGIKMLEVHYKDGKKEGLQTHWYTNGEKWYELHYKYGKKDGLDTEWYFN